MQSPYKRLPVDRVDRVTASESLGGVTVSTLAKELQEGWDWILLWVQYFTYSAPSHGTGAVTRIQYKLSIKGKDWLARCHDNVTPVRLPVLDSKPWLRIQVE